MTEALKTYAEWAVDMIKTTDKCPGPPPPGVPESQLLHLSQFITTTSAATTHDHGPCGHFKDELLGISDAYAGMSEIKGVDAKSIHDTDVEKLKPAEIGEIPAILRLKRDLHTYVDAIEMQPGNKLHIPKNLLHLSTFLKEFFDLKE
jgi:hypothetical protein